MASKLALVSVPFLLTDLHASWMQKTIESATAQESFDKIAVINRCRPEDRAQIDSLFSLVEVNDQNILARAWNRGIRLAFERGATHVLVTNLDVIFHPKCLDNLLNFAITHSEAIAWSPVIWKKLASLRAAVLEERSEVRMDYSCFLIDRRFVETLGEFDEQFVPAYYEDADMLYRIKLAGQMTLSTFNALYFHLERGTLKGMLTEGASAGVAPNEVISELDRFMSVNVDRYIQKWGGRPGDEKFTTPYGR